MGSHRQLCSREKTGSDLHLKKINSVNSDYNGARPFQGPRMGSYLTLRNEFSEETHMLRKQEILLGRGTRVESVEAPRRTRERVAVPRRTRERVGAPRRTRERVAVPRRTWERVGAPRRMPCYVARSCRFNSNGLSSGLSLVSHLAWPILVLTQGPSWW